MLPSAVNQHAYLEYCIVFILCSGKHYSFYSVFLKDKFLYSMMNPIDVRGNTIHIMYLDDEPDRWIYLFVVLVSVSFHNICKRDAT